MNDFLLGDITKLHSHTLIHALSGARPSYPLSQLNRVFAIKPTLTVHEHSTHPRFEDLLNVIGHDNICKVDIVTHDYEDDSLGKIYGAKLFLENGVIQFLPIWTAYKALRAEEIVTTLLKPLKNAGLGEYVWLDGATENRLNQYVCDGETDMAFIRRLFAMTNKAEQYDEAWYNEKATYLNSL